MAVVKGQSPISGGLSKGSLALLNEETRAKYGDDGLLLDGTIDNSPLEYIYKDETVILKPLVQQEEQPQMVTMSVDELNELLDKKLEQKLANRQEKTPEKPSRQVMSIQNEVFDDIPELRDWEVRERIYVLSDDSKPLSFNLPTRNKGGSPLLYINRETSESHALFLSLEQSSFFKDKHKGDSKVHHLHMKDGMLSTTADDIKIQKFLEIHPQNAKNAKDGIGLFKEYNPSEEANKVLAKEDLLFDAQKLAREISFPKQKAVARLMCEDFKDNWSPAELKQSLFAKVKGSPEKFIKLANDHKLELKDIAKTAVDRGLLKWKEGRFYNESGDVLVEVPKNHDEYDSIAEFFLTSKGKLTCEYLKNALY